MKKLLAVLLILGLGLAGVAYYVTHSGKQANGEDLFTLAPVEYGSLADTVGGSGIVQPRETLIVMPKIAGQVVELGADFNQVVEEGQMLCRLDDSKAKDDLEKAELAVQQAEVNVKRAQGLRDAAKAKVDQMKKLDPMVRSEGQFKALQFELDAAEETVRAAELKVKEAQQAQKLAEIGLKLTVIRVPVVERIAAKGQPTQERIDSDPAPDRPKRKYIVMDRKAVLGRNVGPTETTPLFVLVSDLDRMQLQAQIAEGDISKVREGMKADFTVSAYAEGNVHFSGTLSEVRMIPANELGAVFYRVVIDVENQKDGTGTWKLRPGMTASVDIIRRKHDHTWKVPTSALNFQPDEQHLTDAARAKLAAWERRTDRGLWKPVWILNEQKKPWPVFVRVGGTNKEGDEGIRDGQYTEVLEWDPELRSAPDPANEATYPKVINGTKAPTKGGLFSNMPNIKF